MAVIDRGQARRDGDGRSPWPRRPRERSRWRSTAAPTPTTRDRDEGQPGVELLGEDELGEREGHDSDREDAGGMRDRDGAAEEERMTRRPFRPDEVRGDERLSVTRSEGVPPESGDQKRGEEDAGGDVSLLDEGLEPPPSCSGAGATSIVGGAPVFSGVDDGLDARHGERRPKEVLRIRGERLTLLVLGAFDCTICAPSRAETVISCASRCGRETRAPENARFRQSRLRGRPRRDATSSGRPRPDAGSHDSRALAVGRAGRRA